MPDEQTTQDFIYVSVHPEAAFRALSEEERTQYRENETTRLLRQPFRLKVRCPGWPKLILLSETRPKRGLCWRLACPGCDCPVYRIPVWNGSVRHCSDYRSGTRCVHHAEACDRCTYIAPTAIGKALGIGDYKINLEMIAAFFNPDRILS